MELPKINEWQYYDETGTIMPWFSGDFLQELVNWDISNWNVFEYGAGWSTIWWAKNAAKVYSVDHNKEWIDGIAENLSKLNIMNANLVYKNHIENEESYINAIDEFPDVEFDCIVIDGTLRLQSAQKALKRVKTNGIIIMDDSERALNTFNQPNSKESYEYMKGFTRNECHTYRQVDGCLWNTTYWKVRIHEYTEPTVEQDTFDRVALVNKNPDVQIMRKVKNK